MGGLDARYLITFLDPDRRVKSLLTVATPHRGTPVATWLLESRGLIPAWIRHIGRPGLGELTPEARAAMPIPDRADVNYSSYAGYRPLNELPFWLRPYGRIVPENNDGLVQVSSAQWGRFRGIIRADHWSLSDGASPCQILEPHGLSITSLFGQGRCRGHGCSREQNELKERGYGSERG